MTEQERRQSEKTNYYLVLELDFRKPELSGSVIGKAFAEKQKEWSKNVNNPAKGREARKKLDLTGKTGSFQRIMLSDDGDVTERREEAEAARKIADEKIESIINNFSGIKKIDTSAMEKLLERNKKFLITAEEFRRRLKENGIEETAEASRNGGENNTAFSRIKKDLEIVGRKSLYEYLFAWVSEPKNGRKKTDGSQWTMEDILALSCEEITEISDSAYQRYNGIAKKDEEVSAGKSLASACRTYLADARKRREYDDYLSLALPEEVCERIDGFGIGGAISLEQSKDLLVLYASLRPGLSVEEMIGRLRKEFIGRKIFDYEFPHMGKDQPAFKRCNLCGRLSEAVHTHCAFCGKPFRITCFRCGAEIENGISHCPGCGTDLKAKADAEEECAGAEKCLDRFDFAAAAEKTERAKRIWPECPLIAPLEKKLQEKRLRMEERDQKIRRLVRDRRFVEAKVEYDRLAAAVPGYGDEILRKQITGAVREAGEWLRKAQAFSGSEAQLVEYCSKALALCADLQEARMLVLKYPPGPASNIRITANARSNLITWDKSPSEGGILYRLVRKEGSVPESDTDGQVLTETGATQFEDEDLKANTPMFYSVYTFRSGVSSLPVTNREAVYNYPDVEAFEISEADRCLNLSWKRKSGMSGVELYRKEDSPPAGYGQGEKLPLLSGDSYSDLQVQNDRTYFYTVYALYRTGSGMVPSGGRTVKGTPAKPPEKVSGCLLSRNGNAYSLEWKPVEKGTVEILMRESPWEHAPGSVLSRSEILSCLQPLPVTAKSANRVDFQWEKEGVAYLYPVNFVNRTGMIGDGIRISGAADFTGLQEPKISGSTIYLFFDWSCKAARAAVLYKTGALPAGPEDPSAEKIVVTREQFLREKCITVYNAEKSDYYFVVYAAYGDGIYSSGISAVCRNGDPVRISYSVRTERNLMRRIRGIKVTVWGEGCTGLPRMLLFRKNGVAPIHKGDGVLVCEIESGDRNSAEISIPDTGITEQTKFTLFFEDDSLYSRMILRKR